MTGTYKAEGESDFQIKVENDGEGFKVTVTRKTGSGRIKWVFTGSLDAEGVLRYTDCVKTVEPDGEAERTEYTEGKGKLFFDRASGSLTWEDEEEKVAKDLIFKK